MLVGVIKKIKPKIDFLNKQPDRILNKSTYRAILYIWVTMSLKKAIPIAFLFCFLTATCVAQLPAFPRAQGYGQSSVGGRGGTVIEVTNLNDAGPGSFREACEATGPRIIVFRTGGVINLTNEIQLTNPYVTIAGQTAPGDGIVLKNSQLSIFTHDVIVRGMRFRVGDDVQGDAPDIRDCVSMQTGSHHIIFDHCSFSWGLDENVSMLDTAHHITIQWCLTTEALYKNRHPKGPHSMGMIIMDGSNKISVHHNLFAHNNGRNPVVMGAVNHEFVNNIIYDWGYSSEFQENGAQIRADILRNYWKPLTYPVDQGEHPVSIDFDATTPFNSRLFIENNLDPYGLFLTPAEIQGFGANAVIFSATSLMDSATGISFFTAADAYDTVLAYAGAIHPQRDATDLRVIQTVRDSTGGLLDCMNGNPILLDSGNVMIGTDSSIIYSQLNVNPAISPEGREIHIISGTGAGQMRTGIRVHIIDIVNRIVEGVIDAPWNIIPDSTSVYEVIAPCQHHLNGYPVYTSGTSFIDTDHDGMPDSWETNHNLNLNDPSDRNGTGISGGTYTNVEVYLNEYYEPATNTGIKQPEKEDQYHLACFPNPFNESLNISFSLEAPANLQIEIFDVQGRSLRLLTNGNFSTGYHQLTWNGADDNGNKFPNGIYFIETTSYTGNQFSRVEIIR